MIHRVAKGECLSSIGFAHGFFPGTLWDHPGNAELRALRKNPNVLLEGDAVCIPDLRVGEVSVQTGKRHRFRRKGVPEIFRLKFLDESGAPRAGLPYTFVVDGVARTGTTGADGELTEWIPPDAREAVITLRDGTREETYRACLGHLDPITEPSGVRARLENLGFLARGGGGEPEDVAAALAHLQREHGLPVTGKPDDGTLAKLLELHGS